jgi:hypothetical protein
MGSNRAGANLRRKRKRHEKNLRTQEEAMLRAEKGAKKKK